MKKILKMIRAGVLMSALCVGLVACNEPKDQDPKEEGTEIQHVPTDEISAEVVEFFRENNRRLFNACSREGIFSSGMNVCAMINSVDELPESDPLGAFEYPDFDFDSYTLILGQALGHSGEDISARRLVVGPEKITMYIYEKLLQLPYYTYAFPQPFWEIYPRLPDLPISLEYINQEQE